MMQSRQRVHWLDLLLCTVMVLTSCTYETALRCLSPAEQAEFHLYRHVMTSAQVRTYLAQASATAHTAYLSTRVVAWLQRRPYHGRGRHRPMSCPPRICSTAV